MRITKPLNQVIRLKRAPEEVLVRRVRDVYYHCQERAEVLLQGCRASVVPQFQRDPAIKVIGVFDTVASQGYPENPWFDVKEANKFYSFHSMENSTL